MKPSLIQKRRRNQKTMRNKEKRKSQKEKETVKSSKRTNQTEEIEWILETNPRIARDSKSKAKKQKIHLVRKSRRRQRIKNMMLVCVMGWFIR